MNKTYLEPPANKDLSEKRYIKVNTFEVTSQEKSELNFDEELHKSQQSRLSEFSSTSVSHEKTLSDDQNVLNATNPILSLIQAKKTDKIESGTEKNLEVKKDNKNFNISENVTNPDILNFSSNTVQIVNAVDSAKNYIVQEISETFDKKLEKLDEALIELINCKAENERLKNKIDNSTKENYRLKKEIESFKTIVPGFFIKLKKDKINL